MTTSNGTAMPRTLESRSAALRFGAATLAALMAIAVRVLLDRFMPGGAIYATSFGAVAFAVWFGGRRAAVWAALLGFVGMDFAVSGDFARLTLFADRVTWVSGLLYASSCAVIIALGRGMLVARGRYERGEAELEEAHRVAVRRAEELQALFDAAPVAIWVAHDASAQQVVGNRFANDLVGGTRAWRTFMNDAQAPSDPATLSYRMRRAGVDLPVDQHPLQRAARGETVGGELVELVVDGRASVLLSCNAAPLLDERGEVRGAMLIASDITERYRIEQAVRRSDEAHRLLVSLHDTTRDLHEPMAVLTDIMTAVGRYFRVSRCTYGEIDEAQAHVLVARDYTDGVISVVGRHAVDSFGPRLIAELREGRTIIVQDTHEDARVGPEGAAAFDAIETRSLVCVPLVKSGRFAALLVLHHRDPRAWTADDAWLLEQIAERTWHVVEGARAAQALRESRDVLSLAMRGGRMGAWSRDVTRSTVWWSRELEEIFGLPEGGFAGTEAGFLAFVHAADRAAVEQAVGDAVRRAGEYTVEFRFRHASGEWRWMEGRGRALRDADGRTMLYGLGIDITERRLVQEALKDADRRKDEFLATLAHELRNPLAPIRNATQLLRLKDQLDPDLRSAREIIDRQVQHLVRLVDDLLDVSRISRGKINLQRDRVALSVAVSTAVEASRPLIESKRHALTVSLPPAPILLDADPTRLAQILTNLLNNAAKYTPPGGRIWLSAETTGDEAIICVRDNGIGIGADLLPRIFQMFTQGEHPLHHTAGGLGIGLTLVERLVALHGGRVDAHSDGPGHGSEFVVRLPLPLHHRAASRATVDTELAATGTATRVLVVDDNTDSADSLAMMLRLLGYAVHTAYDGAAALTAARELRPAILLLDIGLPQLNGYEVARAIRAEAWGTGLLLVAISGWGQAEDRRQSREAGFDHHLVKPVDHATLLTLLRERAVATPH